MSGYGMAVQAGSQLALELATNHKNSAATAAVYGREYQRRKNNYAAMDARVAAERNITAIRKDKILTNANIQLQQNLAEAQIRANAAWVGAEGGSVEATVYDTEANESRRMADAAKKAAGDTEGQLTQVRNASLSIDRTREASPPSLGLSLLSAFSNYSVDDLRDLGTQLRGAPQSAAPTSTMGAPINLNLNGGEQYV